MSGEFQQRATVRVQIIRIRSNPLREPFASVLSLSLVRDRSPQTIRHKDQQ